MKKLFYPLCLLAGLSCGQQKPIKSDAAQSNSKYEPLLTLFTDINIDTLEVYSPNPKKVDDTSDVMSGHTIDSINARLFPEEVVEQHFHDMHGLFAIYKFAIDKNRLGLLARTPSEYEPSSIKLFILNTSKDSITSYIELGELLGDAGDVMIKKSWLFRDSTQRLLALTYETQKYFHSADDPKDSTVDVKNYYSLFNLSTDRIDTLFDHQEKLPANYKVVVQRGMVRGE